MATNPIGESPSPVITPTNFPPAAAALIAARLLNRHSAHEIAEAIEVLVDILDLLGGDPDAEDTTDLEDDFAHSDRAESLWSRRDPDAEAGAYAEWQTMPAAARKAGTCMVDSCGHEDDEEDDPAGQCDEDGVNTAFADARSDGPGCMISDPDLEHDGSEAENLILPTYGIDQSYPTGESPAEQQRRWEAIPDVPPLVRADPDALSRV